VRRFRALGFLDSEYRLLILYKGLRLISGFACTHRLERLL
jgi:hypothetical protein